MKGSHSCSRKDQAFMYRPSLRRRQSIHYLLQPKLALMRGLHARQVKRRIAFDDAAINKKCRVTVEGESHESSER